MTPQPTDKSYQVLLFSNSDACSVKHDRGWTIVWLTRERAESMANHILEHLDEFPLALP